jgi:hypothetical protein
MERDKAEQYYAVKVCDARLTVRAGNTHAMYSKVDTKILTFI